MRRFSLKMLFVAVTIAGIAVPIGLHYSDTQLPGPPPKGLIENLDSRFDRISAGMNREQALVALGLRKYRKSLLATAGESGSSGQFYSTIRLSDGYRIVFVDSIYDTSQTTCRVKTPVSGWREIKIAPSD